MSALTASEVAAERPWLARRLLPNPLSRRAWIFLLRLIAIDVLFVGFYALVPAFASFGVTFEPSVLRVFNIGLDGSIPEVFNYLKIAFVVVILATIYRRSPGPLSLVLALCFGFVGLDDAVGLHERFGRLFVETFSLPALAGMKGKDLGELVAFGVAGLGILVALATGWWASEARERRVSTPLVFLLGALAFFAVVVDLLHQLPDDSAYYLLHLLATIEDGGEMLVVTLCCAVVLGMLVPYENQRAAISPRAW